MGWASHPEPVACRPCRCADLRQPTRRVRHRRTGRRGPARCSAAGSLTSALRLLPPERSRTVARCLSRRRSAAPGPVVEPKPCGLHTKYAPRGPCTSIGSPTRRSLVRNGDTSPVGYRVDREHHSRGGSVRRDRVRAARLVPVGGGEADVEVGSGVVARPARNVEHDPFRRRSLVEDLGDSPHQPGGANSGDQDRLTSTALRSTGRRACGTRSAPRIPARRSAS